MKSTTVLGVGGAINHDAAISIVKGGEIKFASHAERYSKIKNDSNLNERLIRDALIYGQPDVIAWYERPVIKKLRQLNAGQFKLAFDMDELPSRYLKQFPDLKGIPVKYHNHHESHAASGYYTSGFDDACVVVIDSIGEYETLTIWDASFTKMNKVYSQEYPHSVGLMYSAMTQRLGLKPQEDEYILMGMAAYGDPHTMHKGKTLVNHLIDEFNIDFNIKTMRTEWDDEFKIVRIGRNLHRGCRWLLPELNSEQDLFNLAAATQKLYEIILEEVINHAMKISSSRNLVMMGGCALNCSANSNITGKFNNTWIMPNPGDAGSCIGVAQYYTHNKLNWQTPYLGHEIDGEYPVDDIMKSLVKGDICGIANGRAEFGPRALGNRTLTADPRGPLIKDKMNEIKRRQKFRPFAPMILEEDVHEYFHMPDNVTQSPYMQFVAMCKYPKEFPAIIHKDGTSRVQTVNRIQHPDLYNLLRHFKEKTGCPMLVNTSLNIKGQPIVNDVADAIEFENHYGVKVHTGQ